jgi:SAM-dependent methyltransferase
VKRVKKGDLYLDIGCCMGQDIRALVHDGAIEENLFGSDLKKDFWDIGYDLFQDRSTLKTKFIEADIFEAESGLKELDGKLDIVHAASFFHLFDWEGQVEAAKRVVRLMKAKPGALVFGRQGGNLEAGAVTHLVKGQSAYSHNPQSWAKLWKQVGNETGSKWDVDAFLGEEDIAKRSSANIVPAGTRFMTFSIRRV